MTDWIKVQGSQESEPAAWDTTTSSRIVYQRRNVKQIETMNTDGSTTKLWEYDERQLTPAEYEEEHAKAVKMALDQARADIDFLSAVTGNDL